MSAARISAIVLALALAAPAAAQEGPRTLVSEADLVLVYAISQAFALNMRDGSPPQRQIIYSSCLWDRTLKQLVGAVTLELKLVTKPTEADIEKAVEAVCLRSPILKLRP